MARTETTMRVNPIEAAAVLAKVSKVLRDLEAHEAEVLKAMDDFIIDPTSGLDAEAVDLFQRVSTLLRDVASKRAAVIEALEGKRA